MRKQLTLLACGLLLATAAHAQSEGMLGVKAGLNASTLTVNFATARNGLHTGLFYRSDPMKTIGYQTELLYSVRGADWRVSIPFTNIAQEASIRLNYLDLPVMAVYRPIPALELHGGGYVGYLLSSQYNSTGFLGDLNGDLGEGQFNSFDAGILAGVAVNLGPVQISGRYNFGLTKVSGSAAADFVLGDANNRFGQIFAAFILPGTVRRPAP
jgi:hypothetical protein